MTKHLNTHGEETLKNKQASSVMHIKIDGHHWRSIEQTMISWWGPLMETLNYYGWKKSNFSDRDDGDAERSVD